MQSTFLQYLSTDGHDFTSVYSTNQNRTVNHSARYIFFILLILAGWFAPFPVSARADGPPNTLEENAVLGSPVPSLFEFRKELQNGRGKALAGVYVPGVFAYRVVQQPSSNPGYVSTKPDVVTQFSMATSYGTTGLLAHNYLAGTEFFKLQPFQEVILVYADGSQKYYLIQHVDRFQALQPGSPYSSLRDLKKPQVTFSVEQVFHRIYGEGDRLVFQTCIEADGLSSWGRLFVTAYPVERRLNPGRLARSETP